MDDNLYSQFKPDEASPPRSPKVAARDNISCRKIKVAGARAAVDGGVRISAQRRERNGGKVAAKRIPSRRG